jgi:hypothetical protein
MHKLKIIGSSYLMYFYCFKTSEGSLFGPELTLFEIPITLWKIKATNIFYEDKKKEHLSKNSKGKRWSFGK